MLGRRQVGGTTALGMLHGAGAGAVGTTISPAITGAVFRRRCGRCIAVVWVSTGYRHSINTLCDVSHLNVAQLLFKELEISSTIAHLRVKTGANPLVISLSSHGVGGVD